MAPFVFLLLALVIQLALDANSRRYVQLLAGNTDALCIMLSFAYICTVTQIACSKTVPLLGLLALQLPAAVHSCIPSRLWSCWHNHNAIQGSKPADCAVGLL
jgi:hypothetical protein